MKRYNFSITQGDDYNQNLIFKESNGDFVNLAGSTVKFTMKKKVGSEIVIQKNLTVIDAIQGRLKISLSKIETNALYGTFVYDCEMTDSTGIVSTIFGGKVNILSDIT